MNAMSSLRASTLACVVLAAALGGCAAASPANMSPPATVFAAKSTYATALKVAVTYKQLPRCATPPKHPCSDPLVVERLQKADNAAAATLDSAELAVRSGGSTGQRDDAITAARAAVAAFSALVQQLQLGAN